MITILVEPAKRRFSRRKQWKFSVTGGNHKDVDPRDTYANVGDIREIWSRIVQDSEAVRMIVRYRSGDQVTWLRRHEIVGGEVVKVYPDTAVAQAGLHNAAAKARQDHLRKGTAQ